jgi:hypothetical protein
LGFYISKIGVIKGSVRGYKGVILGVAKGWRIHIYILPDDGEHFYVDAVELVEARPGTARSQALRVLYKIG